MGNTVAAKVSEAEVNRLATLDNASLNRAVAADVDTQEERVKLLARVRLRRKKLAQKKGENEGDHEKPENPDAELDEAHDEAKEHRAAALEGVKGRHEHNEALAERNEANAQRREAFEQDQEVEKQRVERYEEDDEHPADGVNEHRVNLGQGVGQGKPTVGYGHAKGYDIGEGDQASGDVTAKSAAAKLDPTKKSLVAAASHERVRKQGDLRVKSQKQVGAGQTELGLGVTGSASRVRQHVDHEGHITGQSAVGANGVIGRNGASGNVEGSRVNADGTAMSGGLSAQYKNDGSWSANLHGSVANEHGNGVSLSLNAGSDVQAEVEDVGDGKFAVHYKVIRHGGYDVGGTHGKAAANLGVDDQHYEMGTRYFEDEGQAKQFKENVKQMLDEKPRPDSVQGALSLEVGESRGLGKRVSASGGVSGSFEAVNAGVGGEVGNSEDILVERISEKVVRVSYKKGKDKSVDASLGGPGGILSATAFGGNAAYGGFMVDFDLSTDEGRKGFELFQKQPNPRVPGAQNVQMLSGDSQDSGDGVNSWMLGTARHTKHTGVDRVGDRSSYDGSQAEEVDPTWFAGMLGDKKEKSLVEVDALTDKGQDAGFMLRGEMSGESGAYNRGKMQALSSGRVESETWDESKVKSSGAWTMTADIDEKRMQALERYNSHLKGDKDHQMRGLTQWIADDGAQAIQTIDRADGAGALQWDLTLKGDPNFPGREGRIRTEARIKELGETLSKKPESAPEVLVQVDREIATLDARYQAVQDPAKYSDLPQALRTQQLQMLDEQRTAFGDLRHRALVESTKNQPGESAAAIDKRLEPGAKQTAGPLAHVRDQIAQHDSYIAQSQQKSVEARAAVDQAIGSGFWKDGIVDKQNVVKANQTFNIGKSRDDAQRAAYAKLDEQRTELMNAVGAPDTQLSIAQQLLTSVNEQDLAAADAYMQFYAAADTVYSALKPPAMAGHEAFWKDVAEDHADRDGPDDDVEGGDENVDDDRRDPAVAPKAVALDEHPKRSRR